MRDRIAIAIAALAALVIPIWLLWPAQDRAVLPQPALIARPQTGVDPASSGERQLFAGAADAGGASLPQDAPALAGIVGRLPHDAVALIRIESGGTKTLAPGQSYEGWRLEALSAEAALFSRGPRRIRVPLPAVESSTADPAEASPPDQ